MTVLKRHILLLFIVTLFSCFTNSKQNTYLQKDTEIQKMDTFSFDKQLEIFNSLGYHLNKDITKSIIFENMKGSYLPGTNLEEEFNKSPFDLLYYYLGWRNSYPPVYYTDNCIWYDLEFIDPSSEYISFMKRMGTITNGEILYSDISLRVDDNNYEWIDFKVNGNLKSWKLAKVGFIDDSFFQRFSYLPKELNTKGKYTYYDNGGQQFVIDYATEDEQKYFIEKTGLKREWLGQGNHFSEHDPNK